MSTSISSLQSILSSAIQNAGLSTNNNLNTPPSGLDALSSIQQSDNGGLSPFAQLMNTLQQLQQSDPAKYQQVTQQIATNLQSAAQTAQTDGNTTLATQLSKLSTDFSNASTSGQLPNIQDLAKAIGGHHHHHGGHHAAASSDSDSDSTDSSIASSSTSSSSASQTLSQLFSPSQSNGSQSDPLNPLNIILSTLSNAGITANS